jgi:hypothetical protein
MLTKFQQIKVHPIFQMQVVESVETNENLTLNIHLTLQKLKINVEEPIELVCVLYRYDSSKNEICTMSESFILTSINNSDVEPLKSENKNCAIFTVPNQYE